MWIQRSQRGQYPRCIVNSSSVPCIQAAQSTPGTNQNSLCHLSAWSHWTLGTHTPARQPATPPPSALNTFIWFLFVNCLVVVLLYWLVLKVCFVLILLILMRRIQRANCLLCTLQFRPLKGNYLVIGILLSIIFVINLPEKEEYCLYTYMLITEDCRVLTKVYLRMKSLAVEFFLNLFWPNFTLKSWKINSKSSHMAFT